MKKLIYTALLSAALIQSPPAHANFFSDIGHGFTKLGDGIKHTADDVGDGIKHTVYQAGDAFKSLGNTIGKGTMSALNDIGNAAKQSADALKKAAWETGDAFKKAGYVTGDAFKTAAYATGKALTSKEFVQGLKIAAVIGDQALTTLVPEVAVAMQIPAVKQMHDQMMQQMLAPPQPQRQPSAGGEQGPPVDPNAPIPELLEEIKEPVTSILTAKLCNDPTERKNMLTLMRMISGEELKNVKNATVALASAKLDQDTMVGIFKAAAAGSANELLILAMLFNGAKTDAPAAIRKISSACPA